MEDSEVKVHDAKTVLDVLAVWPCARAIFRHVPVRDLVRSERVSRDWQHAVHDYLRSQRTLSFINLSGYISWKDLFRLLKITTMHRVIYIDQQKCSWPNVQRTLVKFGTSIVKMITISSDDEYFDAIASNCPYLRHLEFHCIGNHLPLIWLKNCRELKDVLFIVLAQNISDHHLCEIFQNIDCEKITIRSPGKDATVTGSFLRSIKYFNLQSLRFEACYRLNIHDLHSSVQNLRNLTCFGLDKAPLTVLAYIHLLLDQMPKLEELSLRFYFVSGNMSEEIIKSICRLGNLKCLDMSENCWVNDTLLEEIARGCRKLEYLNLCGAASEGRAAGLAALCRKPSSVTTFHAYYRTVLTREGSISFSWWPSVVHELEALGCVKLTSPLLGTTLHRYPIELKAVGTPDPDGNHKSKLQIILAVIEDVYGSG